MNSVEGKSGKHKDKHFSAKRKRDKREEGEKSELPRIFLSLLSAEADLLKPIRARSVHLCERAKYFTEAHR